MTDSPHIELLELGAGTQPVAVIDGFASSPEHWRNQSLGPGYAARGDFYPGQRRNVDPAYFEDVGKRLGKIMRSAFGCSRSLRVERALYSIVDTNPADLSLAQRIPHFDNSAEDAFALVHYLSLGRYGGTAFYRHRSTGMSQIHASQHAEYLEALGKDFATHGEPRPSYIDGSTAIFEQIGRVDFANNRAAIYRANQLHCPIVPNDVQHLRGPTGGRLTIAVFFRAT